MKHFQILLSMCVLLLSRQGAVAQNLITTKHNLSVSGTGTIKAETENEVCVFCHTPHKAKKQDYSPLWNRSDPGGTYTMYSSTTTHFGAVTKPDGSSTMCLSCHDGTVALGSVLSRTAPISFGAVTTLPAGKTNLGLNLKDDHPISFTYDAGLAALNGQLFTPDAIAAPVTLDANSKMQCTSCHDAHDNTYGKFLVASNRQSALCYSCHNKAYWANSSHKLSFKTWNGAGLNPWPNSSYTNVSDNACENCHTSHNAGSQTRILSYLNEEDNCMNCHNGNVATKNVQADLGKIYKHNVYAYTSTHDEAEAAQVTLGNKHVECVDCHNPHATNNTVTSAPDANGSLQGAKGVDYSGTAVGAVSYEYQICFRCHADNALKPRYIARYRGVGNTRLDFATSNVSFHPVEDIGRNSSMTSLAAPYTVTSKIFCSDCHAGDGGVAGPHGSNNIAILKAAYDTTKFSNLGAGWAGSLNTRWPLCFQCHTSSAVATVHTNISGGHFMQYVGCATCHDPHGYDGSLGTGGGNILSAFEYLCNFDTTVIKPNTNNGKLIDIPGGKCYFVCHNPTDPSSTGNHVHLDAGSNFSDVPAMGLHGHTTTTVRKIKK